MRPCECSNVDQFTARQPLRVFYTSQVDLLFVVSILLISVDRLNLNGLLMGKNIYIHVYIFIGANVAAAAMSRHVERLLWQRQDSRLKSSSCINLLTIENTKLYQILTFTSIGVAVLVLVVHTCCILNMILFAINSFFSRCIVYIHVEFAFINGWHL